MSKVAQQTEVFEKGDPVQIQDPVYESGTWRNCRYVRPSAVTDGYGAPQHIVTDVRSHELFCIPETGIRRGWH